MAKHTCGCDENAEQSVGSKVIQHILCVKSNQSLVIGIAERLLPKLFWLSIIASIVLAFRVSSFIAAVTNNAFYIIVSFIVFLIAFLLVAIMSFYMIYLLKALKDGVVCKDGESCGCKDNEATESFNSSVSFGEAPIKIKKKPGPKKGSKRGKRPRAAAVVTE
ncbi:MAG: hypothetical protein LBI78_00950 [Campylobacteraceae bacterium]|jgi:hypothetical protein|nr:hypothetical protein [Campylobacteraceae bacterium]